MRCWKRPFPLLLLLLISCLLFSCTTPLENRLSQPLPTPAAVESILIETAVSPTSTPPSQPPNCGDQTTQPAAHQTNVPQYAVRVLNSYPHDTTAWTQGLAFYENVLYESTGDEVSPSSLRRVDLPTGNVDQIVLLDPPLYGEGMTIWDGEIYQITWRDRLALVYDLDSFEVVRTFEYETEGWGLTHNGRCLIMSDGTDIITFRDPDSFEPLGTLNVTASGQPISRLNELEFIDGEIWANVWLTNWIVRINPQSGAVVGWIDVTPLDTAANTAFPEADVANGIALNRLTGQLFITGKLWPTLYEIELIPIEGS